MLLKTLTVAAVLFLAGVFVARASNEVPTRGEPSGSVREAPEGPGGGETGPASRSVRASLAVAAAASTLLPHRGLPASLADVPRGEAYTRGIEALRAVMPPENVESIVDYRLQFTNRLETCAGQLPRSGKIVFHILFQPPVQPSGALPEVISANRVTVEESSGLSSADAERLAGCGGWAAYGLPLTFKHADPDEPQLHHFLGMTFPIDADAFPYKTLRTGEM